MGRLALQLLIHELLIEMDHSRYCLQKWIPLIKYQLLEVKISIEPHMLSLKTKTIEVYETSKSTLAPHIVKVQEVADPYFQVFFFSLYFVHNF